MKAEFKIKAKSLHPDKGGSSSDFHQLNEAKDVLMNQYKRKMYEKWLLLNEMSRADQNSDFMSWFQREEQRLGATFHWVDATSLKIAGSAQQHEERIYRPQNRSKLRLAFNLNFSYLWPNLLHIPYYMIYSMSNIITKRYFTKHWKKLISTK